MALKIDHSDTASVHASRDAKSGPLPAEEDALRAFQASATALALIEAFARVTAHRIVADAEASAQNDRGPRN